MSGTAEQRIIVLFPDELLAAAKALRRATEFAEDETRSDAEKADTVMQFIHIAHHALYHLMDAKDEDWITLGCRLGAIVTPAPNGTEVANEQPD